MTKFKKQMITFSVLLVLAIALLVGYIILDKEEVQKNPAPEITGVLQDGELVISGLKSDREYIYSLDYEKSWAEIEKGKTEFSVPFGKMCFVKEKDDKSEAASVGGWGEKTKDKRPYVFDTVDKENMNSVLIHNEFGEYSHIHRRSGAFVMEGLEGYSVSEQMMVFLRAYTLDLLALRYVDTDENTNLEDYGISLDNPKVYFVVTYNNEKDTVKVIVGDKTPDNDGYYAVLDGRDALYVIGTGIETFLFKPLSAYVTPTLVHSVENNKKFTLKDFTLYKNGEKFITIEEAKGQATYGNKTTHRVTYPAYNYATNLTNFDQFLNSLIAISGSETLLYGENVTEEKLVEYGFFDEDGNDTSDFSIKYSYPAFSEELFIMNGEEEYIVYSKEENIVTKATKESFDFLEWDMLLWISSEIFLLDIEEIKSVTFEKNGERAEFTLSGEAATLNAHANGKIINIEDFKQLYRTIFYVLVTSYSDESDYGAEQLRMMVETEKGETLDYRFYRHSAQNSFYTLNGFGEFYVSSDKVDKLGEEAFKLLY